ncbi:MAG: ABC transporter ATP-binding protein, partial [Candidatus Caldatribacterium sp.]|nr:ABC transporter ATP-binding protein [Candidatus Caldatribacterium sp.]
MSHEKRTEQVPPLPFRRRPGHFPVPAEQPKDLWKTLRRLWEYLKDERLRIVLIFLCVAASSSGFLIGPYLIGKTIDEAILTKNLQTLTRYLLLLAALYLATSFFSFLQERLAVTLAQNVALRLRNETFSFLHTLPLRFFDTHEHGDIMSRLTNDIDNISSTLATTATQFVASLVTLGGTVGFMFAMHWELACIALVTVPLSLLVTRFVARKTRETFFTQQTILGSLTSTIEEDITGL